MNKMERFRPLKEISLDGNIKENLRKFKQQLEIFLTATEKNKENDHVKVAILLSGDYNGTI